MLTPFGGEKLKIITYRYIIKTGTHKWKALVLTYTNMHCLLKNELITFVILPITKWMLFLKSPVFWIVSVIHAKILL